MGISVHNPGDQKTGIYPFKTKNILPNGEEIIVKSHSHRKQLMKRYNLHDDHASIQTIQQRRRWYGEEKKEKGKDILKEHWYKARRGEIDLRPINERRRKRDYLLRNGYIK